METRRIIYNDEKTIRIDVFLSEYLDCSRSYVKKICDLGNITVNDKVSKSNKTLKKDDCIIVNFPKNENIDSKPQNLPLNIVYQDNDVAVINKEQGVTVHAGNGTKGSTLVNALLYHLDNLSGINGVIRPGIVHRIDKNTSGLLVVAKNDRAHVCLAKQLEDKTCSRKYIALLEGVLVNDKGTINTFIGRNPKDRTKMTVLNSGRTAITDYKVIERYVGYTLCEFSLRTGRTHQIRVHSKHIGHPIVGDPEYGYKNQKFNLNGQLLHAYKLEFTHPTTKKRVGFECELPDYFSKVLKSLKKYEN